MLKQRYVLPILALIIANIFWGLSSPLIKIGLETIPVPVFIAIRFFLASMLLLPFALRVWRPLKTKHLLLIILAAILDITLSVAALNYGLTMTTASNAGVIWLLMPIMLIVLSVAILKETLRVTSLIGIFVALVGGLVIIGTPWNDGGSASLTGNLLVVLAVFLNALSFIIIKPLTKVLHHLQIACMCFFIGVLPVIAYASTQLHTWQIHETSTRSWTALLIGIIIVAIANPLFFFALRSKSMQNVSAYQYIDPLAAVIGAWFLLSERPTLLFYLGTVLIAAGVYIVEVRSRAKTTNSPMS